MAAERFLGDCSACSRLMRCKMPESYQGRIAFREGLVTNAKVNLKLAEENLKEAKEEKAMKK